MKVGMRVIIIGIIMFVVGLVFFYSIQLGETDPVLRFIKNMGTFIGLSGMGVILAGTLLHLLNKSEPPIKENFQKAGVMDIITIKNGLAIQILTELNLQQKYRNFFDFVLIDADKESVIEYFDLIFPMVSVGGVIVTDNMLYPEKFRKDMKKFSDYLKKNPKLRTITSPIGNGEEITIKLK